MNDENLKGHGFHEIAAERQREIARKGADAANAVRRNKKTMREWAQTLGSVVVTNADGEDITKFGQVIQKQIEKAINESDTKSAEFLANLLGEMKQQVEHTINRTDQQAADAFDKIFGNDENQ